MSKMIPVVLCCVCISLLVFFGLIAFLISRHTEPAANPPDLLGFALFRAGGPRDLPPLLRYEARDGERLAYRFYDSESSRVLIFVHGSSYHGAGYHELAVAISSSGAAKVILPNLRGHYMSGRKRGDVDYVGQLEDDVADLIGQLRAQGFDGEVFLGGHSSGGGFVIRFAGGAHAGLVSGYAMLAPVIPLPPFMRNDASGGWANVSLPRIIGLSILNSFGVHAFNELEVINFNKPAEFIDGTETLSYSFNLNSSYHPRYRYAQDLKAIRGSALVLIGDRDETIDAGALREAFAKESPGTDFRIMEGINHFGIFTAPEARQALIDWLKGE